MRRLIAILSALSAVACAPVVETRLAASWQPDPVRLHYPREAYSQGVTGVVVLRCRVAPAGKLTDCIVHDETPPGFGFGEAALLAAPDLTIRADMQGGEPGRIVQYAITFRPD